MKLYLSSYHLGEESQKLADMFRNKRVALISNALDFSEDLQRKEESKQEELRDLASISLNPEEIDLRDYYYQQELLKNRLKDFGGIWVRGGNCFILRKAMAYSGLDNILKEKKASDFVYAGYSAGACVAAPSLKGLDLIDDSNLFVKKYKSEIIWQGLSLIKYSIVPHYQSNHPESHLVEKAVEYFTNNKIPFKTLKDGEVIVGEVS
jgi:dipeptidase E